MSDGPRDDRQAMLLSVDPVARALWQSFLLDNTFVDCGVGGALDGIELGPAETREDYLVQAALELLHWQHDRCTDAERENAALRGQAERHKAVTDALTTLLEHAEGCEDCQELEACEANGELWRAIETAREVALSAAPAPAASQWQPFSTAPTDGTEIIVYRPDAGVFTAWHSDENDEWDGETCGWYSATGDDLTGDLPTHWMPLPAEPAAPPHGEDAT